ncbi:MAG: nitrate reductase cytochrome c-type subunit [Campylobacterales bacterium]|nr:nitrate reductase cytochrome c-type subunit [Campylobacterales bacterium]
MKKITLSLALCGFLFVGCTNEATVSKDSVTEQKANFVAAEEIGLRKQSVKDEKIVETKGVPYSVDAPGTSKKIERSFDNAPPMIPHDTEGMLPITKDSNQCTGCHMPVVAKDMGATPIPKSHFTNLRKEMGEKGRDLGEELYQGRFNCSQCHAPQAKLDPLVKNNFKPDFKNPNAKFQSNLIDSINEGVK